MAPKLNNTGFYCAKILPCFSAGGYSVYVTLIQKLFAYSTKNFNGNNFLCFETMNSYFILDEFDLFTTLHLLLNEA